ncbi:phage baseplate assembly protein V [Streptomyces sp. NPDC096132]|uniref:phage baseplate assembly protein V n=1 Tax=Streptomyces sp. NPDC096132 TaxID=3366075 RepID=UPI003802A1DC
MSHEAKFFGKYRGVVVDNDDPERMGRINARMPAFGDCETGWALPCMPFAGSGTGFFALPAKGAWVWIEYEQGDRDRPIWTGSWWGSAAEMPSAAVTPPQAGKALLRTADGASLLLDDTPGGGITLQTASGQTIALTASGIEIDAGQGEIRLKGARISLNDGALEVT